MDGLGMDVLENARELGWLIPDWPAPSNVRAVCTTRQGGVSVAPFDTLNLGNHVRDEPEAVAVNRQRVREVLQFSTEPLWLEQVHGVEVFRLFPSNSPSPLIRSFCKNEAQGEQGGFNVFSTPGLEGKEQNKITADASTVFTQNQVSVIMTADCLPVLFCDRQGTRVASAHAGWRGLCNGVLEATLRAMDCDPAEVMAWLGPAIGPDAFEVGAEVREAFMQHDARAESAFKDGAQPGKYLADIYQLARQRLTAAGVQAIYGGGYCTVSDPERFFSYRREAETGRMASLVWMV